MEENHIFTGLRRDNHPIRQDSKFLWDAHNIRLTNRENSTLLSITNEKGPKQEGYILGHYVGHAIVGKYLVVFTCLSTDSHNYYYIVRVEKTDKGYSIVPIFTYDSGEEPWDKGWDTDHPIEALGVYETELIQKVYWIDGKNQPRVINVVKELEEGKTYKTTDFDFVQTLQLKEEVSVEEIKGNGMFAPGVIQYAFTYYNKYGAESNIFYTTSLQYITYPDRGGDPEDRISTSFKITVRNVDDYEYVRVYSIHRTSIDGTPTVKLVSDVEIIKGTDYIELIDTGTIGEIVDNTYLFYVGGRYIVPQCMTQKDGTLFFGNVELQEDQEFLEIKNLIQEKTADEELKNVGWEGSLGEVIPYEDARGEYYNYQIHPEIRRFKSNEYYRLGLQFQRKNGSWTEPIFLMDSIVNSTIPLGKNNSVTWYTTSVGFKRGETITALKKAGYVKARTCVVFPNVSERSIICQGVLCPTVFSNKDRENNNIYARSSWFFRPGCTSDLTSPDLTDGTGLNIQYAHNKALPGTGKDLYIGEIEGVGADSNTNVYDAGNSSYLFFVDENTVTMHSPDIEFDTSIYQLDNYGNYKLKILGFIELEAISGDINVVTSSAKAGENAVGFIHKTQGYTIGQQGGTNNGGLIYGVYNDGVVKDDYKLEVHNVDYLVYAFNNTGSLNNDNVRLAEKGTQTAVLSKKVISNLKYFNKFTPINLKVSDEDEDLTVFDIKSPQLFSSNEVTLKKVWNSYLKRFVNYFGNTETAVTFEDKYNIFIINKGNLSKIEDAPLVDENIIKESNEPVSIKYKSSPHLVFSLGKSESKNTVYLPPVSTTNGIKTEESYPIPEWDNISKVPSSELWDSPITLGAVFDLFLGGIGGKSMAEYHNKYVIGNYVLAKYKNSDDKWVLYYVSSIYYYKKNEVETLGIREAADFMVSGNVKVGTILKISGDRGVLKDNTVLADIPITEILGEVHGNQTFPHFYGIYKGEDRYFKVTSVEYPLNAYNVPEIQLTIEEVTLPDSNEDSDISSTLKVDRCIVDESVFKSSQPYLCLAELRREVPDEIRFGGTSDYVLKSHLWYPSSEPVELTEDMYPIPYLYGDTWCQRYDCLKTYPFTREDENQIVEIGSFMCETRVNIDGRYDANRGQLSNLDMSPINFNLINEVYSQKDNYFNFRILDTDYYKINKYPHQVIWSTEKQAGSDVDNWTQITMASTLDMDGTRGPVTKLTTFNEALICFQEKALSTILFNSRVQIPVSDGVPVEISNGQKVDGYRFISDLVGCQNKWSVCNTSKGVYFIDDNTDSIWAYDGSLINMSETLGMKWWSKKNHSSISWNPQSKEANGIRTFYDPMYGDVYFTPGPEHIIEEDKQKDVSRDALCYSEQLGQFVSQYSYGGTQAMMPFNGTFISLRQINNAVTLWENFKGDYNNFFNVYKTWDFSFISNDNPTLTKVFDTIEFRADQYIDGELQGDKYSTKVQTGMPLTHIQVDNEYQDTDVVSFNAHTLRKKFRVWRGQIPRNKLKSNGRDRIRNPWTKITLSNLNPGKSLTVFHDISVKYTI